MKTRIDIEVFYNGETEHALIKGVSISVKAKKKSLFYNDINDLNGADICCLLDALTKIEEHLLKKLNDKGLSYDKWKKFTKVVDKK